MTRILGITDNVDSNALVQDIFFSDYPLKQIDVVIAKINAANVANAVPGVHTLELGTAATAGDKIVINGVDYEFATTASAGKVTIGADTTASATSLTALLNTNSAISSIFTVTSNTNTILFTQKTAGIGALPSIVVVKGASGTLVATIETTTTGSIATEAVTDGQDLKRGCIIGQNSTDKKHYAWDPDADDGTENIVGILAIDTNSTEGDEPAFAFVVGEFAHSALSAAVGVTIPKGVFNNGSITIK